jgi:hypothetical protein
MIHSFFASNVGYCGGGIILTAVSFLISEQHLGGGAHGVEPTEPEGG